MKINDLFYGAYLPVMPLIFFKPWLYLAIVLGVTALLYGWDKWAAIRKFRRVPECALLFWALAGGSPAALVMMLLCRHKVAKPAFFIPFLLVLILQAACIWYLWSHYSTG